jgi:hypothetical protein
LVAVAAQEVAGHGQLYLITALTPNALILTSLLLKGLALLPQPAISAVDRSSYGVAGAVGQPGRTSARQVRVVFAAQAASGAVTAWRRVYRHSLSRLWVPHSSFHSASQAPSPRRMNRWAPCTVLSCPKTGSMVWLRSPSRGHACPSGGQSAAATHLAASAARAPPALGPTVPRVAPTTSTADEPVTAEAMKPSLETTTDSATAT